VEGQAEHRPWVVIRREDGVLLGAIGADVEGPRVNVGYVLARAHWGQGYMSEALIAVRDAAFADRTVHRVQAFHHVDNSASGRVMDNAGMRREGTLRRYMGHPQQPEEASDVVMWAIARGDLA